MDVPKSALSENEVEFLAEDELITITPAFHCNKIACINSEYGPFRPNFPTDVPLWLAVDLKRKKRCKVQPPAWLSLESLQNTFQEEKQNGPFSNLPYHYIEIGTLLLTHASDDIRDHQAVRAKLLEIQNLRTSKIRGGLQQIEAGTQYVKLNNISAMELNTNRSFLMTSLDCFYKISSQATNAPPEAPQQIDEQAAPEQRRRLRRFQPS